MFVADSVGILCRHCKRNTGLGGKLFMKNTFVGYTKWKRKGYTINRNSSLANLKLAPDQQILFIIFFKFILFNKNHTWIATWHHRPCSINACRFSVWIQPVTTIAVYFNLTVVLHIETWFVGTHGAIPYLRNFTFTCEYNQYSLPQWLCLSI